MGRYVWRDLCSNTYGKSKADQSITGVSGKDLSSLNMLRGTEVCLGEDRMYSISQTYSQRNPFFKSFS